MSEVKMDRSQYKHLIGMLDAIYGAIQGWDTEKQGSGRHKALDYVGWERGVAKGNITREQADEFEEKA